MRRVIFSAIVLFLLAVAGGVARDFTYQAPKAPLLYKRGTVDTGSGGQVEILLADTDRATYGWQLCNKSADDILLQAGGTFGVALPIPVNATPGSPAVAVDNVVRLSPSDPCLDSGDFSGASLILQAEDTNGLLWVIVGKK